MCVDRIPVGDSSFACEDFAAFKPWPPAAGDRSPRCCHALTVIGCLLLPRPAGDRLPAAGDTLRPLPRSAPPLRRHAALRTRPASPHVATLRVALILRLRHGPHPGSARLPRPPHALRPQAHALRNSPVSTKVL